MTDREDLHGLKGVLGSMATNGASLHYAVIEGVAREALDAIDQLQRDLAAKERVVEAARDAKDAVAGSAYMTTGLRDDFNSHQRVATVEIGRIFAALAAHDEEIGNE